MKYPIIILSLAFVLFTACQQETAAFVGSWELDRMEFGGKEIRGVSMNDPVYTFHEDGTYDIIVKDSKQEGTWELDDKSLMLTDAGNKDYNGNATIISVDDKSFVYEIYGLDDSKTTVYLVKK